MSTDTPFVSGQIGCPLRIAALVKQIPSGESMTLGEDGRLVREGLELEMNAFCRRAVAKAVAWAKESGGSCTVFTLGPPSADDVLREAIAWGADQGVHLCDPAFAGSDTLATARALSTILERDGPFDLVLVGHHTLDGETGQVGPEIAELLGYSFAGGVRVMGMDANRLSLTLEDDDGSAEVTVALPAVLSVAERLCEPCKAPPPQRAGVRPERITRISATNLAGGPWGDEGSPTAVGAVRAMSHVRTSTIVLGTLVEQAAQAVDALLARGALTPGSAPPEDAAPPEDGRSAADLPDLARSDDAIEVGVIIEPERQAASAELLGAASRLARAKGARVTALAPEQVEPALLGELGADHVLRLVGNPLAEDVAVTVAEWSRRHRPWAVLAPSTAYGREVAGRVAAALGSGLVGDAVDVNVANGELVAAKPAFSGALVADITFRSPTQLVTIRPGVLPVPSPRVCIPEQSSLALGVRGRVTILSQRRNDDVEVLARAEVVIGMGTGVRPEEYEQLDPLARLLKAEMAATRKVTDQGWAPHSRQIGVTGRSIAPRLYVAMGLSGKFNHMVGVRGAGTILAINDDAAAPIFAQCDIGLVGDWRDVVPALADVLREHPEVGQAVSTMGASRG